MAILLSSPYHLLNSQKVNAREILLALTKRSLLGTGRRASDSPLLHFSGVGVRAGVSFVFLNRGGDAVEGAVASFEWAI